MFNPFKLVESWEGFIFFVVVFIVFVVLPVLVIINILPFWVGKILLGMVALVVFIIYAIIITMTIKAIDKTIPPSC